MKRELEGQVISRSLQRGANLTQEFKRLYLKHQIVISTTYYLACLSASMLLSNAKDLERSMKQAKHEISRYTRGRFTLDPSI